MKMSFAEEKASRKKKLSEAPNKLKPKVRWGRKPKKALESLLVALRKF